MKKIKDKVKALELLQQRDSNPKITCQWIADQCGYSRKQIERLSAERKEKDTSAILTHGNTGKKPATTASDQEIGYLEELKKTYPSITIAQFRDIYLEDVIRNKDMEADVVKYGLKERSKSWFRELFVREGWKSPADKPIRMDGSRVTHSTRPPRAHMGELVQIDGTPYDWFNDGRDYVLHLAVDDASTRVLAGYFMPEECARGYARMMKLVLENYGIPEALYSDKFSVFRSVKAGTPTQFARMMDKLGVTMIFANSSQAKGRVERYNGTAQMRLPNDLIRWKIPHNYDFLNDWFNRKYRLYLNMKFSYPVKDPNDLFRPIPADFNSSKIFRAEYPRQIRNNVFSMGNSLYTAVTSDGEVVPFNQKQSITVYEDAITEEIYIERYGKHYTCMKVGERKRGRIYSVNNEKELQKVLNEMAEEKNK